MTKFVPATAPVSNILKRFPGSARKEQEFMSTRFASTLLFMMLAAIPAGAQNPTPVGIWEDSSERVLVRISPCGNRLCGKIVWFRWPNDDQGLPLVDLKNVDPSLQTRPLLGLKILYGLHLDDDGKWTGGKIYNPDDGVDYNAQMWIQDDGTLRVRLYELFPLFGETQIWARVR
jgi:uncharacterized protein (DUF2147 family)